MDFSQSAGVHNFQLTDAGGCTHSYVVQEHPGGEGCDIFYQLMGLGAPTVLGLLGAAVKAEDLLGAVLGALGAASDEAAPAFGLGDFARSLAGLDFASVGQEIGKALATGKAPALTRAILNRTFRDGQKLNGQAFEAAYQANYMEMLQAIWKVCQVNRFFPDASTLQSLSPAKVETKAQTLPPGD